jgi:hypothetical protein
MSFMSADNWEVCPRCFRRAKVAANERAAEVYRAYGKVPPEEFAKARSALREPDREEYRTFREDYEFYGADVGVVSVEYSGRCDVCGLSAEFHAEERFFTEET